MSPDKKKYSFDFMKWLLGIVVMGMVSWYSSRMSIQYQFAEFKEELHVFMAEEKAVNNIATKDIEYVKVDIKEHKSLINELDKKVFTKIGD
jgi:hypothetical protein